MKTNTHSSLVVTLTLCFMAGAACMADTVEPEAKAAIEAMSKKLAAAKSFTVSAQEKLSDDLAKERGAPKKTRRAVSVQRPDKVFAKTTAGKKQREFYFDGKNVTVHETGHNVFATAAVEGSIDDMIDHLEEKLEFLPPIADLLVAAPDEGLLAGKQTGKLVGEEKVGKTACKRYAFSRETLDWEIWIGEDDLPRRFAIHYKDADDVKLTQTVTGLKWDLEAKFEDGTFTFKAPEGATQIKIVAPDEVAGAAKKAEEK